MTFEDLWEEVRKTELLPNMAIQQISESLSESTRKRLCRYSPHEVAELLVAVIDEINHGSVETVDALLRKKIQVERKNACMPEQRVNPSLVQLFMKRIKNCDKAMGRIAGVYADSRGAALLGDSQ